MLIKHRASLEKSCEAIIIVIRDGWNFSKGKVRNSALKYTFPLFQYHKNLREFLGSIQAALAK